MAFLPLQLIRLKSGLCRKDVLMKYQHVLNERAYQLNKQYGLDVSKTSLSNIDSTHHKKLYDRKVFSQQLSIPHDGRSSSRRSSSLKF